MPEQPESENLFIDTLRVLRRGACLDELADELRALVAAVQDTGKPGALALVLAIKPDGSGAFATVTVADKISARQPKITPTPTILFTTPDHGLRRQDPRQTDLLDAARAAAAKTDPVRSLHDSPSRS